MTSLRLLCFALLLLGATFAAVYSSAVQAAADCAPEQRITRDFDNGARWDFCWESRIRENIVLSDIHYTPPSKAAFRVLGSARLAQLHVAYDDSDVTYNDITQYGLGGSYLLTLTQADCPNGELLDVQTRPAVCIWQTRADKGYQTPTQAARAASLQLFSVSQVGAYAYIVNWIFYDDGTFEPGIGATGALQRNRDDITLPYGRVLQGDPDTLWLSHTHNYYWRLDFDLGLSATDDIVEELQYTLDSDSRRTLNTEVFSTEQARRIDPAAHRLWRIMDSEKDTAAGYQIEPLRAGHRFERKDIEPYSDYDFFVTVGRDCERFASQNSRFNPDCDNNVLEFVNNQSLQGRDIVLWNRVSFHHTPRSEDQRNMHTHWDDFRITPVNLLRGTSTLTGKSNSVPEFVNLPDIQTDLGGLVHANMISANDMDADVLTYSARGLPPGLRLRPDGHVHGYPLVLGSYTVEVTASDDFSETTASFEWLVGGEVQKAPRKSSGALNKLFFLILLMFVLIKLNRQLKNKVVIDQSE